MLKRAAADSERCPTGLRCRTKPGHGAGKQRLNSLSSDDLLAVIHEFINPQALRSGLDRCLRRHRVSDLNTLQPQSEGQTKPLKTFQDYEPGFLHIDIKYLPQMPDETHRRYLFVAIDRATRWDFMRTYCDQSDRSSTDFLRRLKRAAPMKIKTILTDNGSQFTDRFTSTHRSPSGQHVFDLACLSMGIEHHLCPPWHPQTTAWSSALTAASATSSNKPDSAQPPNSTTRCSAMW